MLRRGRKSGAIAVAPRSGALIVQGESPAVVSFAERVRALVESSALPDAVGLAAGLKSAIDSIPGRGNSGPMLFELSPESLELLRAHGAIAKGDGYFRSMVHDGERFAGNLDWKPFTPGPDLLAFQTAALGLALDASIKQLADAVQRVEQRVDEIRDLVRSDQVGEVLGHHRVLQRLLELSEAIDAGGTSSGLSDTDWNSIDQFRREILSSLDRTRFFIQARMASAAPGRSVKSRVDAAENLVDADLADALGLLATSHQNLVGWHRLRLDRIARVEPGHLDAVIGDIEQELATQHREDQKLVDALREFVARIAEPSGYEGLEIWQRNELVEHIETIGRVTEQFARQRGLSTNHPLDAELPGLLDSLRRVRAVVAGGTKSAVGRGALTGKRLGTSARKVLPGRTGDEPRAVLRSGDPENGRSNGPGH